MKDDTVNNLSNKKPRDLSYGRFLVQVIPQVKEENKKEEKIIILENEKEVKFRYKIIKNSFHLRI